MINVSNEFKETMETRTDFKGYANILLDNGTALHLDESQFTAANNYIVDGAGLTTLPLGVAVQKNIQIEIINDEGQYSGYDFVGATIALFVEYALSSTTERVLKGYYTVLSPATYGDTIIITAVDDMHFADITYTPTIDFPATAAQLLADVCFVAGIVKGNVSFSNDSFTIQAAPTGTCREIIGYISMLACGNARINNEGKLDILPYDFSGFDNGDYHTLKRFTYPKFEMSDVSVTGVKMNVKGETADQDKTIMVGSEGYVITVENPLVEGNENTLITWLLDTLSGVGIRPFSGDMVSNPLVEFMDLAKVVDRDGNEYNTIITDVNFQYLGYTTVKNTFPNAIRLATTYSSDALKVEQLARKWVAYERQSRQEAITKLNQDLANSSGLYQTDVEQSDGSTISYFHDKPTLEESKNVLKITSEAIGISNDGGETYHGGFTFDAETVMKFIETEGLEADWVKVGNKTITTVIDENVTNLQNQIDDNIESHYYDYAPSLSNIPASLWTTEEEKARHEGDLFFDKTTGYKYRFFNNSGQWEWVLIKDTDVTAALQRINEVDTELSVFEGEITARVNQTESTATSAQKTASEAKIAVGEITLSVTGPDGTVTSIKIDDGTINLTGEVLAQRIAVATLMAQDLIATGSFQVNNDKYMLLQDDNGFQLRTKEEYTFGDYTFPRVNLQSTASNLKMAVYNSSGLGNEFVLDPSGASIGNSNSSISGIGATSQTLYLNSAYELWLQVPKGAEAIKIGNNGKYLSELFAEKAPAGYGYGEALPIVQGSTDAEFIANIEQLCTEKANLSTFQAIIYPRGAAFDGNSFIAQIWHNTTSYIKINAHCAINATAFQRVCYLNTWADPEWVNPPMVVGVEYRTTERWSGSPVYCMTVDYGQLPASTYKAMTIATTVNKCLRYNLVNKYSSFMLTGHKDVRVDCSGTSLQITTYSDLSNYYAWCTLWYTKG